MILKKSYGDSYQIMNKKFYNAHPSLFMMFCSLMLAALGSCDTKNAIFYNRPNIIFLLADDLGYGELGSYGQDIIKTPELDKLANDGMRFTDFYAGNGVCSPSRSVLLTGKSASHTTIRGNAGFFGDDQWHGKWLDKNSFTLGEMMKGAGYQTAFIGKWHLDNPDSVETWAYGHGFDYAVQEQWKARFNSKRTFPPNRLWINGDKENVPYNYKEYDCKDALRTEMAFKFLDKRDDEKPFFLFMSYRAPHSFEGPIRDTLFYSDEDWPDIEKAHAAKITLLDRQIGRLFKKLNEVGELDNTLILFTSDNGPHGAPGGHDYEFFNSNGNLKGFKRDLYEGGVRVPLIAFWKNKIEEGAISNHISAFQDIMPTLAEVAGINIPDHTNGLSFLPTLLNQYQKNHEFLNWEIQLSGWFQTLSDGGFRQSCRMGNWKGVRYGINSEIELYNLDKDISEINNVASQHPELVNKISVIFETNRTETPGFPYGGVVQNYKSQDKFLLDPYGGVVKKYKLHGNI
tara:strand:- start:1056 stop:2597 length:1542 start_codon:yes stop_codon:yes gene_type:complete